MTCSKRCFVCNAHAEVWTVVVVILRLRVSVVDSHIQTPCASDTMNYRYALSGNIFAHLAASANVVAGTRRHGPAPTEQSRGEYFVRAGAQVCAAIVNTITTKSNINTTVGVPIAYSFRGHQNYSIITVNHTATLPVGVGGVAAWKLLPRAASVVVYADRPFYPYGLADNVSREHCGVHTST